MTSKCSQTGLRITTILVCMVVGVVAVLLCCFILLFLFRYRNATVENACTTSAQAVSQVSNTVSNYLAEMEQARKMVEHAITQPDPTQEDPLASFLTFRPDVVAVTCYDKAGDLLQYWSPGHTPRENILKNLSFDLTQAQAANGPYMSAPHVESIFEGFYPWVVTLTFPIPEHQEIAWVSLDLRFSNISRHINTVSIGQRGYCFLMDEDGNIIYHPQQQLLYAGLKAEDTAKLAQIADGTYTQDTVIYSLMGIENSEWRVVGVSYVDELVNRSVKDMVKLALILSVVILLAALGTSWLLSHLLSRPLRGLTSAMESFENNADQFHYQPVGGTREVQELSCSFGHMVMRIQQLMTTVREEEVNLRKTELKALQAQINPHFLYNTLDSIAWMCEQGRTGDAVKMVHALARLFRISISKDHELIPISREIEHAQSYLEIQKYRYKNRFTYQFYADPVCLNYLCNKITLQPLIENSINHGLDLLVDEGRIEVYVQQVGADIVFRVLDNGVGMSEEQITAIMEHDPTERSGIGIRNVNDRLQIYFGKEYGLHITSKLDVGTCVEVRMPKVREETYETK